MMITIKKYENLKVYQVDATDAYLKKFISKTESGQGRLKIYLDESKNLVYFKIYSVDEGIIGCNETYDNLRLDEIDMDLIKAQFSSRLPVVDFSSGPNGVRKKKVEFKKKKPAICRCYYAVEFSTDEGYNDLTDTFSYLLEVYAFKENNMMLIDSDSGEASTKKPKKEESNTSVIIIDDNGDDIEVMEKKEDVNHLIAELQRLIRAGESEKAAFVVRRLARMRLDLEISLSRPDKDATIVENKVTEETIKQPSPPPPQPPKATKLEKCLIYLKTNYDDADEACIHVELEFDVLSTKVSELKEKISDLYGVVAHRQNLIINDCAANDADFLNAYEEFGKRKVNNGFASANAIEEDVYKIYVFINDEQQMSDDAKRELVEDNHEPKRHKVELIEDDDENKNSFAQLAELYNKELNENSEPFACDICLDDAIPPKQGVILKECMHTFCKECLRNHINCCDDPVVKCPFRKDYNCAEHIQEREIRALLNEEEYEKFQMKSLRMSEAAMQNTFHCLTPDCIGFCVSEDNLNFYDCPVCEKVNCLRCNTIHMGKTCKEYQDDLKINAINDKNAKKDKEALEKLISTKKAMYCPGCKIILCKQTGCDWLQCPMCKMEICWATRGPRWGPNGRGDTSGGCKCNLAAGKPCTPNCGNCH